MSIEDWKSFAYWKKIYDEQRIDGVILFRREPLTNTTVFLWSRVTPSRAFGIRKWEWFPEAKACVGYLRYIVLPKWFRIWLGIWEEDGSAPVPLISAEEIFTETIEMGAPEHIEDIPLMRNLIAKLDALFDASDDQISTGLGEFARVYNEKWTHTPTWESQIQVFDNPIEVGEELIRRAEIEKEEIVDFESYKSHLRSICSNALSDENSQKEFLLNIEESEF